MISLFLFGLFFLLGWILYTKAWFRSVLLEYDLFKKIEIRNKDISSCWSSCFMLYLPEGENQPTLQIWLGNNFREREKKKKLARAEIWPSVGPCFAGIHPSLHSWGVDSCPSMQWVRRTDLSEGNVSQGVMVYLLCLYNSQLSPQDTAWWFKSHSSWET